MKRSLAALAVLVTACSPGGISGLTTTASSTPTTLVTSTSSSTTAAPATTTTSVGATTTMSDTTTTVPLLEGNWADGPLITTEFGALGWWDGGEWLDAETQGALPVVGGEDYQVTRLGFLGMTTAGPQTTVCEPLELLGVDLADPELLGTLPGPYGVAISAAWVLQPHIVEETTDDGGHAAFAAEILADRGLDVDSPVIKQLIRTDLDGDGVNEVLVVAEEVTPGFLLEPGDYSIVLMRKVIDGEVRTAVLDETIVLDEDGPGEFGGAHTIGTVADLNGDQRMEIVTNSAFFEGFGMSLWEYVDDVGPVLQLQSGCGS